MEIKQVTETTPELLAALERLIPQLSDGCIFPGQTCVDAMIRSGNSVIFVAEGHGEILGTLTLVMYRIMTGTKAWIEDVVVDSSARGKGIGRLLMQHAMDFAREKGAGKIDLTSAPSREAANLLYQSLGFRKRDTNVYRHETGAFNS